jgi:hypothetical protein
MILPGTSVTSRLKWRRLRYFDILIKNTEIRQKEAFL